jgi:hypothetical protein
MDNNRINSDWQTRYAPLAAVYAERYRYLQLITSRHLLQISTFQWLKITQGPSKDYNTVSVN